MATIDRTPNGGTIGHPGNVARPYVMTSKVHDTADGGTGGDVIQLIDVKIQSAFQCLHQSLGGHVTAQNLVA